MSSPSNSESGGTIDEKKRRRMASNRESARRSRQRKQQHLDDLIKEVANLKHQNEEFDRKIREFSGVFATIDSQNGILRSEKDRLAAKLESLESIIEIAKVVSGSNESEISYEMNNSDPMMKPWKLPCPSMPIMASSSSSGARSFNYRG